MERRHAAAVAWRFRGQRGLFGKSRAPICHGAVSPPAPEIAISFRSNIRQNYTTAQLNSLVPNPFQPYFVGPNAIFNEPDSRYNDPTIPLINLLRPYPQFDGAFDGFPLFGANSRYNSLQIRFENEVASTSPSRGVTHLSRSTDNSSSGDNSWVGWYSAGGPQALDRLSNETTLSANNATQRLAAAFTAQIPVGRGLADREPI